MSGSLALANPPHCIADGSATQFAPTGVKHMERRVAYPKSVTQANLGAVASGRYQKRVSPSILVAYAGDDIPLQSDRGKTSMVS